MPSYMGNVAYLPAVTLTTSSNAITVAWANGINQSIDLENASGTVTLTLTGPLIGATYKIEVIQGSVARNITWPVAVLWPGGTKPVISVANNAIDLIELFWDGTNYLGQFAQAFA